MRRKTARIEIHTGVIANHRTSAAVWLAVPKDAKVDALEVSKGNALDYGSRESGQQQQYKGDEE